MFHALTGRIEEHTVDAPYETSKEEMRKVYESMKVRALIGLWEGYENMQ